MSRFLPARPDFEHLRHEAKDLLRAAKAGDAKAAERMKAGSDRALLASAQLAVAREYGFASWTHLKVEVERRKVLNDRDLARLKAMIAEDPALATSTMINWCDHKRGATPLGYIAMLRFDSRRLGLPQELPGTEAIARTLIENGALVDGHPDDQESPLMTAASYGDADVARVLVEAGADLEEFAAPNAGGVPGGTALVHAAVFGMTDVVDVLVEAGARIDSLVSAAAAGDISAWPLHRATLQEKIRALVMAADHQRLSVIDQLLDAGAPIDEFDAEWGRRALHVAAQHGRPRSVRHLLARGADANVRDPVHRRTALDLCQPGLRYMDSPAHDEVDTLLRPRTT